MEGAKLVGNVSSLRIYPIKSFKELMLQEALCTKAGIGLLDENGQCKLVDRHFLLIKESGVFVTQRMMPKMATVQLYIEGTQLTLSAPDLTPITIPIDEASAEGRKVTETKVWNEKVEGVDCGDAVAEWLTGYLGKSVRLLFNTKKCHKRELMKQGDTIYHKAAKPGDSVAFQDFGPFMMTHESSLEDLNSKLKTKVDMRHFRPNITVKGDRVAWDEDRWRKVQIGEATFTCIKPCDRCVMTTVDPDKGVLDKEKEPLRTLRSFRIQKEVDETSPIFGQMMVLDQPGKIAVGDPVHVVFK